MICRIVRRDGHPLPTLRARHRARLKFGAHGLPLMGCGDWNDGMNGGNQDAVKAWAGLLLYTCLPNLFRWPARTVIPLFRTLSCRGAQLQQNIEQHAWTPVVPTRLLRQRRTARLPSQSRMSD